MNDLMKSLSSYFIYLIHPFETHAALLGEPTELKEKPEKLTIYESLGASWIFVVLNGLARIVLINCILWLVFRYTDFESSYLLQITDGDGFIGFYFLILSTILDVIFYPLFTLFLVQFWEFIMKLFSKFLGVEGNHEEKAKTVMSVALSSHILMIVPIFGSVAQKFASLVLMYAGLRKQFKFSPIISLCVMLTPIMILMGFLSIILLIIALRLL